MTNIYYVVVHDEIGALALCMLRQMADRIVDAHQSEPLQVEPCTKQQAAKYFPELRECG